MLYAEFIAGTGCKATEHNYKVYKDLEIMYMNSDISKEQIYEYGKKLVDNSLTAEQIALNAEIDKQISEYKDYIEGILIDIGRYEANLALEYEANWKRWYKERIKDACKEIKEVKTKIRNLKACKYTA